MSVPKEMPLKSIAGSVGWPNAELVTSVWAGLYRPASGVHSTLPGHHSTHIESALHSCALTRATQACHGTARVASLAHKPKKHVNE